MYEEIKKNIIDRFMVKNYLWTCCASRNALIADMQNRIPFNIRYPNFSDYEKIEMVLGDNVSIMINLKWEQRTSKNSLGNEFTNYRLISIS